VAARKSYLLRIDPELWAQLERWAADELRSANGQMEFVLREALIKRRGAAAAVKPAASAGTDDPAAGGT
jgi:hypothetical protein